MLKREVDFIPLSPKKAQISRLGVVGAARSLAAKSLGKERSRLAPGGTDLPFRDENESKHQPCREKDGDGASAEWESTEEAERRKEGRVEADVQAIGVNGKTRTTEEKMEILGGMLGNVDALVEGVRKAGVWGLG